MGASQPVAGEDVKRDDDERTDADREIEDVEHARTLWGKRPRLSELEICQRLRDFTHGFGARRIKDRAVFAAAEIKKLYK
jgi:hypothetical protein